ncbi:1,2-phenylacetyl-CoA epoxidase subunit PaaD [Microbacterium sp. G2-8]|uniref:1,2-phenylacetyl-CoA epoxidase subunit PaaD n=1 Tax=Microbacterium sp. G2-8 TaxID=2842454 RepID=UPI001C88E6F5|nr:1,2-phenylacetyl-CoA epoxidase subunit PaaD [Microbacterium sp. G2-8]
MQTAHAQRPTDHASATAWDIAAQVTDPEVPVLTIEDLGVLRRVVATPDHVRVVLTPTYSGCPAIEQMRDDVMLQLTAAGYGDVRVDFTLSPSWTTDWMSDEGRRKLEEYGIAPPNGSAPVRRGPLPVQLAVKCPRCGSLRTREVSRYGSTACKAHYECLACLEPFDFFKVH